MSLPLPSSPHWVPTTTVAGTRLSSVANADYAPVYPAGPGGLRGPAGARRGSGRLRLQRRRRRDGAEFPGRRPRADRTSTGSAGPPRGRLRAGGRRRPTPRGRNGTAWSQPGRGATRQADPDRGTPTGCVAGALAGRSSPALGRLRRRRVHGHRDHRSATWSVARTRAGRRGRASAGFYGVSCPTARVLRGRSTASGNAVLVERDPVVRAGPGHARAAPLNSVSCASPTFCVALTASWPSSSTARRGPTPAAVGPGPDRPDRRRVRGLVRVADLLRLGQHRRGGEPSSTARPGATTPWSTTAPPPSRSRTSRAPSPTFCVVVSATGNIATFDGTAWTAAGRRPASRCSTRCRARPPTFCMAVDLTGHAIVCDGSTWSAAQADAGRGRPHLLGVVPDRRAAAWWPGPTARSSVWQAGTWRRRSRCCHDGTLAAADVSCADDLVLRRGRHGRLGRHHPGLSRRAGRPPGRPADRRLTPGRRRRPSRPR